MTQWSAALCLLLVITMPATHADIAEHPDRISDAELWAAIDLQREGLEDVRVAVQAEDWGAAAEAWAEYFRARETPTPHFRRDSWPNYIRENYPQLVDPIIAAADEIRAGDISHGPYVLRVEGDEIKWLENPTGDTNYVSAVGSQWFLNPLGRAYLLTGDERYAETFAWIFGSWFEHQTEIRQTRAGLNFDPIYRGYYPGIRARILTDNYYCLARTDALTPDLQVKLLKALLGACAWSYAQERPAYRPGNQQIADVVGLGVVGIVFPEFRDAERWLELAELRMREHLAEDFHADGGHRELCTQYHKTVLRDIGYVALTAEATGLPSLYSDPEAGPLFERACEWLAKIVMPTGETPALHSAVFATDYAVHLELAARHFDRPDFAWLADRFWERGDVPSQKSPFAFSNYMLAAPSDGGQRPEPRQPDWLSVHLEESGFAIMRTGWAPTDRYLLVQHGWPLGGHGYPGALHFIYEANGELIATGPGSPRSYRDPAYRYCHSSPSHNMVTIDGASYPNVDGSAPGGHVELLADLPGAWMFSGYHEGYRRSFGVVNYRDILVVKDGPILIRDRVEGPAGRDAQWNFHTPLRLRVMGDRTAQLYGSRQYTLSEAYVDDITDVRTERKWEAVLPRDCQPEDCGKPVSVLRWEKPIKDDGALFAVALIEGAGRIRLAGESGYRITDGDREWLVLFSDRRHRVEARKVAAMARCVCVEMHDGEALRAWVFDGTRLTVDDLVWLSSRDPVTREVTHPKRR